MNRYPKLMVGALSAVALALPFAIYDVALGQTQTFRQIAVEPQDEKKPAAETAEQDKAGAKAESTPADAAEANKEAAPEEKAAAVADDKKPAAAPAETGEAKAKEETETASKTASPAEEKAPAAADAAPEKLSAKDIILALQTELKRVGCYYGSLDGIWGPRSYSALEAFGHFGKIELNDFEPSEVWIKHVKDTTKTVCHGNYGYARPYDGPGPGYGNPPPRGYPGGRYQRY